MNLTELTIDSLHELLVNRKASAVEITQAHFAEIERRDKEVRGFSSCARSAPWIGPRRSTAAWRRANPCRRSRESRSP